MRGDPLTRNTASALPLRVVDGFTVGRDGKPLSRFAAFVDTVRLAAGAVVTADAGALAFDHDDGDYLTVGGLVLPLVRPDE